jgi:hypothetical protein
MGGSDVELVQRSGLYIVYVAQNMSEMVAFALAMYLN